MKRKIYIFGTIGILAITLVIFLLLINKPEEVDPLEVLLFCEKYPEALVCDNQYASNNAIAEDMFIDVIENYSTGYSEQFCLDYFYGNIENYCVAGTVDILPTDTGLLSTDLEITEVKEGVYDVVTYYRTGAPAWTFRVAIILSEGLYTLSGISYYETVVLESLNLTDEEINDFMVDMISESDDLLTDFCETYFTGYPLTFCDYDYEIVAPNSNAIYHYEVEEISTNKYLYTVSTDDQGITYEYTVFFTELEDEIFISGFEVEEIDD